MFPKTVLKVASVQRLPSLKTWLQSTCLLVFFASYAIFFALGRSSLQDESLVEHQAIASRIRDGLIGNTIALPIPPIHDIDVKLIRRSEVLRPTYVFAANGDVFVRSISSFTLKGSPVSLDVTQDVTRTHLHRSRFLALAVVFAAFSLLFCAVFLRIVMWRGLSLPLLNFSRDIDQLEMDSLGSKVIDPGSQPVEFISIVHSLNSLQERLASSWQRERCFVDGVAHELRTPITVLTTNSQRLLADISDESKPAVQLLISESQRLGNLLSVMLDFARVDAGRIVLSSNSFDPELLCVDAFERLQCLSPDRIRLCEPADKVFPTILVDDQRFHQCMAALVENALRYTHGYVDLSLTITNDHVVFHVIDSGSGIPEGEREFVVTRFARGSTSIGTRGSGIGLAVVQEFMLLMNGRLSICDSLQGGADVRLMFSF